jgi:hypothetical protein
MLVGKAKADILRDLSSNNLASADFAEARAKIYRAEFDQEQIHTYVQSRLVIVYNSRM